MTQGENSISVDFYRLVSAVRLHYKLFFFSLICVVLLITSVAWPKLMQSKVISVIEIGGYMLPQQDGGLSARKTIEAPGQVVSKVENRFFYEARDEVENREVAGSLPFIKVIKQKGSNIIKLEVSSMQDTDILKAYLGNVAKKIVDNHYILSLDVLELIRKVKIDHELNLIRLNAELENEKKNSTVIANEIIRLDQREKLLIDQITRVNDDIAHIAQRRIEIAKGTKQEVVLTLMFDDHLLSLKARRDQLEGMLYLDISSQRDLLEKRLQKSEIDINVKSTEVKNSEKLLERFVLLGDEAISKDGTVEKEVFQYIVPTRVVVEPVEEGSGIFLKLVLVIVVATIVAVVFSIFLVALAVFYSNIRSAKYFESSTHK